MQRLDRHQLLSLEPSECSQTVRCRVEAARDLQGQRSGWAEHTNASVPKRVLDAALGMSTAARTLLSTAVEELSLSGRGVNRVSRVARTIADLDGCETVAEDHLAEALTLRMFDGRSDVAA